MDKNLTRLNPDEEKFLRDFYKQNYLRIYNYIKMHIGDANITKDITSDVFVLACEKISIVMTHPKPEAWLYTVAQNKLKEFYRRLNNSPEILYTADFDNFADDDTIYARRELELTIHSSLTPREYDRYLRYFIWGQTLEELALHEGITKANMAVRLSRLRDKIKALL